MIGIIIGAALTLGIINYGRRHRHGWRGGRGSRCGDNGRWRGEGEEPWSSWEGPRRGGSRRGRAWIHRMAERLDATREQEQVMHDAAAELYEELRTLGREVRGTRRDVGEAFGPERFDEERMGELFATHDGMLERARKAVVGALAKVHDVLEPHQREQIARRMGRRGSYGPYSA